MVSGAWLGLFGFKVCGMSELLDDPLVIGGVPIRNRLFVGTGKFARMADIRLALATAAIEVATVALRRVDAGGVAENVLDFIPPGCRLLPNTSGARTAAEAIRIARLARAAGCGDWIKIEVVSDSRYLLPDNEETLRAVETLAGEGFTVLPYMAPDLYAARRMVAAGAAAVMPLGAPIGSRRGNRTLEMVRILVAEIDVPVIVDAGLGRPSEAAECLEIGCGAVLVNTAIASAEDPVAMCLAFSEAVRAGRRARRAGIAGEASDRVAAAASSPLTGFLRDDAG